jgi:hypothetical protein
MMLFGTQKCLGKHTFHKLLPNDLGPTLQGKGCTFLDCCAHGGQNMPLITASTPMSLAACERLGASTQVAQIESVRGSHW